MRVLTRSPGPYLLAYPMSYLKAKEPSSSRPSWLTLIQLGKRMLENFPPDQRREYESAVQGTLLGRNVFLVGNTMFDLEKISQCAGMIVETSRSATRRVVL